MEELSHGKAPGAVRAWAANLPPWSRVVKIKSTIVTGISSLHAGEREVITCALEEPGLIVLMDERRGCLDARGRSLVVIGTLAVLDVAAAKGWIDLPMMFTRLRATSFRTPLRLMARMLEQDALR